MRREVQHAASAREQLERRLGRAIVAEQHHVVVTEVSAAPLPAGERGCP